MSCDDNGLKTEKKNLIYDCKTFYIFRQKILAFFYIAIYMLQNATKCYKKNAKNAEEYNYILCLYTCS